MNHRPTFVSLLPALLCAAAAPAAAQNQMAPGLWEFGGALKGTQGAQMDAAMAKMHQEMAAMPPEQRQQMEAMMKGRGVAMPAGAGKPLTTQACITPELAARDAVASTGDGDCKPTSQQRSGNTLRVKMVCTGANAGSGEAEYTFASAKEFKGRLTMDTVADGKPQRVEMEQSGRWLATDCGSVKPRK